jgi:hypothetical protein
MKAKETLEELQRAKKELHLIDKLKKENIAP